MRLLLPPEIVMKLQQALQQAGRREIGGIMMGEHVGIDTFRVKDFTVQRKGGTFAAFLRLVDDIIAPLREFFRNTKHDYTKFNYLGEWHSHHSFALTPSSRDHATMLELINDPSLGAHFIILLLVKLDPSGGLDHAVTVYQPSNKPYSGKVEQER